MSDVDVLLDDVLFDAEPETATPADAADAASASVADVPSEAVAAPRDASPQPSRPSLALRLVASFWEMCRDGRLLVCAASAFLTLVAGVGLATLLSFVFTSWTGYSLMVCFSGVLSVVSFFVSFLLSLFRVGSASGLMDD